MTARYLSQLGLLLIAVPVATAAPRTLNGFLGEGRIQEGLVAFASPKDNAARFSLAVLQALDGFQQFSAGSSKLGVNQEFVQSGIPFFRVMMPGASVSAATNLIATPEKVAALFEALHDSLKKANATLATIDDREFKVEINLSTARLDFDGDGVVAPDELLVARLGRVLGLPAEAPGARDLVVHFDSADAIWLRGYTHFLTGVLDVLMAYNWQPVWNQCAHVVFQHPEPAPPIARFSANEPERSFAHWADLIAAVHEMRLQLSDREALSQARQEFISVIACSRICWQRVLAETDNDHEWLPSPKQTGPAGATVTQVQIDGWLKVLDELDAILAGKKLLPHWRVKNGTGISVLRLVASPPKLDLVLLIQGSALTPYLEEGPVSDLAAWRTLMQPFGAGFARFAIWSN